jgi:hypothetical protein
MVKKSKLINGCFTSRSTKFRKVVVHQATLRAQTNLKLFKVFYLFFLFVAQQVKPA